MSDELPAEGTETPVEEQDEAVELASLAVDDGKGGKMVPLSALIGSKKTQRALQARIKELEPIAAGATDLHTRLSAAQPMIDALVNSPRLRAEALRITQGGTRTSAEGTEQPTAEEDPDAAEFAELNNLYLPDGMTLDVARGKRGLALMDRRSGKQADDRIRPLAGITLTQKADSNLAQAMNMTDSDGLPLATRESYNEAIAMIPKHLLADAGVSDLLVTMAVGLDRRKGRAPKAADEPLYLERQGGGRTRGTALGSDERDFLQKTGTTEKDYRESSARLEQGVASRRGIVLE